MATVYYERLFEEDLNTGVGTGTKRNPTGGTMVGTQVGFHSFAVNRVKTDTTWNPAAVTNGSYTSTTVTVTGAALGDFALASFSLSLSGLLMSAYVSATNTVTVLLYNLTGASVDLSSGTLSVLVFKSR